MVHNTIYASGFLYHSASQQILLQIPDDTNNTNLLLFGNKSHRGSDPRTMFLHCIEKALGMSIALSSVCPVYDYIHDTLGEHFIFFIEATDVSPLTYPSNAKAGWFSLSKLSKLSMNEQTRHDIVIGERVIHSRENPTHLPPGHTRN